MSVVCNCKSCDYNNDGYCEREKIHIDRYGGCCDIVETDEGEE